MFNLGFSELLLLGVIALIFIGPQQLPEVARTLARMINEWKRATSDFQSSLTSDFRGRMPDRPAEQPQAEDPQPPDEQDKPS